MEQAADIALVTQKDSEDDGGQAPKPEEPHPGASEHDESGPVNSGSLDTAVTVLVPTEQATPQIEPSLAAGEPLAELPDTPQEPQPSVDGGTETRRYRREDAVSITLQSTAPHTPAHQIDRDVSSNRTADEVGRDDRPTPPIDPQFRPPVIPADASREPETSADDVLPPPAVEPSPSAAAEAMPEASDPPVLTEPIRSELPAPETSPTFARGAWATPPPLNSTPPWVWRDVEPDIFPRDPTDSPSTQPAVPPGEPPVATVQLADSAADPVPAAVDAPPVPDAVLNQDADAAAALSPPIATARQPGSPSAEPEQSPPPGTRLNLTRSASSPLTSPGIEPPPRVSRHANAPPRVEPTWDRPAPQPAPAAFENARPGDFARDGFAPKPAEGWGRYEELGRTALRYAGYAIAGYFALVFVLILLYRFLNPPASSLMLVQALTGTDVRQQWVSLDEISPSLIRAVIVSEDWGFCEHYGIDIAAIEQAIEKSGSGIPRGASTISMQTTKNLFLWNAKSYIRKAVEVPLTLMIELIWPKWRILEIYLNVAEWGPGIFGAEAAAQYHFDKPAARLDSREAAQLAASLPNPIIREAGDPGPRTARKASVIQSRMRNAGGAAACVLGDRR